MSFRLQRVVCIMMFLGLTAMFSGTGYAEKISLYVDDFPINELVRGMEKLGQMNEFDVHHEKYATCVYKLKKGQADMVTGFSLFEFITSQHEGADIVIIGIQFYSKGDVIVLRPEIKSASELKGKTIGVQADCLSVHLLDMYLKKNSMSLNDVKIADIPGENLGKAYVSAKSLSGIVSWPPFSDEAVKAGGKIVASANDFPEKIMDGVVANRESLKKNRERYKDYLRKWFAAVRNPAVIEKTAEDLKVSQEEFKQWLECAYVYQDVESSLKMFPKAKQVAGEIQDFLKTEPSGIPRSSARLFGKEPLNMDSWFDDSLLKEIAKEQ